MEVMAPQRDDFVVGRMIARLSVEVAHLVRVRTLLEMFQQQCLLVSGTDKQDRFAVLQRLIDTWKESRIVRHLAGTDGIGLVMQMIGGKIGMNCLFVDGIEAQKENLGDTMIDPDDGVVMKSHGFFFFVQEERSKWHLLESASRGASAGQCDISTGTVIESNMPRVTPPRMRSFNREWP